MKALRALPTWLVTLVMLPFLPKTHPWHGRRFTLYDWYEHQTPLCRDFDFVMWINGVILALVLLSIGDFL